MITAHGASYGTKAEADARIAELNEENLRLGASDGRVTEILLILEAMIEAGWESTPERDAAKARNAKLYAPASPHAIPDEVYEAERRIAYLERYKDSDDRQWRYLKYQDEKERVTRREYRTELGFLKAYVRAARAGMDILIAE